MKYIFLVNSFTLKADINKLIHNIKEYCNKEKIDFEIEINNESNSTEDILKKYKKTRNIIFSIGGDGTLNRIVNSVANTNNIVGVIPYGTGNDFYRTMKIQFKKGINECDLVKINDKYFINTACFGIDAEIAHNKETITSPLIPRGQRYNAAIVKTFFKYRPKHFKLEVNGKTIEEDLATVIICNGCYYGHGYNVGVNSKLNNDSVDIYLVHHLNRVALAKLILKMKNGHHESDKNITKIEANKLTIKVGEKVKSNIDGEMLEDDKFKIEVLHKKMEIFYDEKLIKAIKK